MNQAHTASAHPPEDWETFETRILLCDSQVLFRQGIKAVLEIACMCDAAGELREPGFNVIGEVESGFEAIRYALELEPDVVIMEISLKGLDGLSTTRRMLQGNPGLKVIILTEQLERQYLLEATEAGARAYIPKCASAAKLIKAIKRVMAGETLLELSVEAEKTSEIPQSGLTEREKCLLQQLASGSSNREIAQDLHISEKTVRNRLSTIYEKLQVHNRTEAAIYAVRFAHASNQRHRYLIRTPGREREAIS